MTYLPLNTVDSVIHLKFCWHIRHWGVRVFLEVKIQKAKRKVNQNLICSTYIAQGPSSVHYNIDVLRRKSTISAHSNVDTYVRNRVFYFILSHFISLCTV